MAAVIPGADTDSTAVRRERAMVPDTAESRREDTDATAERSAAARAEAEKY